MPREEPDVLIIGSGFAGASTAFHLSELFGGSITLIEREKVPGVHASGRNAGLILQSVADPAVRRTIAASRRYYADHSSEVGFRECGSLLLGGREQLEKVRETGRIESSFVTPDEVRRRIPLLEGHRFELALETPGDGVIDIWALLQHYLRGARARGVAVRFDCEVLDISGDGPYRVETSRGAIEASQLINAAGAWAPRVAQMAGATPLPITAWKRHLLVLERVGEIEPGWPFVWSLDPEFYFRPEASGLMLSICDEESTSVLEPTVSPEISEAAAQLVWKELPALRGARQRDVWSCFRTRTAEGRFVVGRDPERESFFWVAGLGGHGVGSSWEVGRMAAAAFCGGGATRPDAFSPA